MNGNSARELAIVDELLAYGAVIDLKSLVPARDPQHLAYVLSQPFAFLVACAFDRGMKSELTWSIPFELDVKLAPLSADRVASMSNEELAVIFAGLSVKPRYVNAAPKTLLQLSHLVLTSGHGDARSLWENRSISHFEREFRSVHGIGPGIASMTSILLERFWGFKWKERDLMDVKPDVHIQRVMFRLGLIDSLSEDAAISAARSLHPDCPADIDPALWSVGRNWCRETNPRCTDCVLSKLCDWKKPSAAVLVH